MTAPAGAVLVIKLGALGDVVQALGPFAAIRHHHADDRVVLLTTAPYVELARATGWFDEVLVDDRPRGIDVGGWLALRRRLRGGGFQRVYDLQTSSRSSFYLRLFWPGLPPEWFGIAPGCSHPHANPARDQMHTIERQAEQLRQAGIEAVPPPVTDWLPAADAVAGQLGIEGPYALLAPGGAAHRPAKRWPADAYGALANRLCDAGLRPVLVGGADETPIHDVAVAVCPDALSLAGATSLLDVAALARGARLAVGNDTGPMHLAALAGCRSVILFSDVSDPALCGQRGNDVTILRRPDLSDLSVDEVWAATDGDALPPVP
jgi:ADP-heptose:LPS heptosyltransferase